MSEVTWVAIVPGAKRSEVRRMLSSGGVGDIRWRERRNLFASDFLLSGEAAQVTKAHFSVSHWMATGRMP
jgi:hypothetical protein